MSEHPTTLNHFDRAIVALNDEQAGPHNALSTVIVISATATAAGVYELTHQVVFSGHSQYDRAQAQVISAQDSLEEIQQSAQNIPFKPTQTQQQKADAKIDTLKAEIKTAKSHYPEHYNHSLDQNLSPGAALVAFGVSFVLLQKLIASRLRKAKADQPITSPQSVNS